MSEYQTTLNNWIEKEEFIHPYQIYIIRPRAAAVIIELT